MKTEMRRALARESYEEKIRKVGQLIALTKAFPRRTAARPHPPNLMTLSESPNPVPDQNNEKLTKRFRVTS